MSMSILFGDKVVRLSDGRLMYFDRWGCNNDNAGRTKDDYRARIFTDESFKSLAESYMCDSKPLADADYPDLKIRSREATMYDLGKHLIRMLSREEPVIEALAGHKIYGKVTDAVVVTINNETSREYSPEGWAKDWAKVVYHNGEVETRYRSHLIYDEQELIEAVENKLSVQFHVE